ncbi:hypothetical protein [Nonomuraea soli]|uniref:Uncharacterized protein n=1 Tax=Nonomuraea soli TaxID=1032476 RepID=A0A7W0HSE3_9ACTN|nr:hypothetical protein [Nonomuraea soli]MBA2893993.1 hypothetical protein [Nonomuraea soli]
MTRKLLAVLAVVAALLAALWAIGLLYTGPSEFATFGHTCVHGLGCPEFDAQGAFTGFAQPLWAKLTGVALGAMAAGAIVWIVRGKRP